MDDLDEPSVRAIAARTLNEPDAPLADLPREEATGGPTTAGEMLGSVAAQPESQ